MRCPVQRALLAICAFGGSAAAEPPASLVEIIVTRESPIAVETRDTNGAAGTRILICDASTPLGWVFPENGGKFIGGWSLPADSRTALRGILVKSNYFNGLGCAVGGDTRWNVTINSVGPGGINAWINAGNNFGVQVGDRFWLREAGQPLVRLDVRMVAETVSFCRVVRLAAGAQISAGSEVASWIRGADEPAGRRLRSAVSFVEGGVESPVVWIAAPTDAGAGDEPRVEFYRDGGYVGFGIVERRDPRFWYVRPLLAACIEPIRVGDDVHVRTTGDSQSRPFSARVFAHTGEGFLITAGEPDGLRAGDIGLLLRRGAPIGQVEVKRAQGGYATCVRKSERVDAGRPNLVAEVETGGGGSAVNLDEVRFGPIAAKAETVAIVTSVSADAFAAALSVDSAGGVARGLKIRQDGRTIGVAVLVPLGADRGVGFVVPETMTAPLAPGAELLSE